MASSVLLLLACSSLATGEPRLAQIDGHGNVVVPKQAVPIAAGQRKNVSVDDAALKRLDIIYSGNSLHAFWKAGDYKSAQKELLSNGMPAKAVLYGEIQPQSFMELLRHAGAKPGMKYYDLGSGTGKTVFAAWLAGLNATGVELVGKRFNTACQAVTRAKNVGVKKDNVGAGVNFLHASFFDTDFSDADIIFSDSAFFSKDMMLRLGKLGRRLAPGTKIISAEGFPGEGYQFEQKMIGKTSRSSGTTWTIQTVKAAGEEEPVADSEEKPASLIRQEPAAPTTLQERSTGPKQGPILGVLRLPEIKITPLGSSCSLAGGEKQPGLKTEVAAAMPKKA